jgi:hypothetical protein
VAISKRSRLGGWTILGDPVGIDRFWGRHLRARCCHCIIECIASACTCNSSAAKLYCIETWTKIIIFYIQRTQFIVCMCALVYSCFMMNHSTWSWLTTHQSQRASFVGEDLPGVHTVPIQSFIVGGQLLLRKLRNSSIPCFDFRMRPDQKWSWSIPFPFDCYCGSVLEPNPSVFEDWFLFPDCYWKLRLVLPCYSHSSRSVYQSKAHRYSLESWDGYLRIWYSKFLEFSFWILVKNLK